MKNKILREFLLFSCISILFFSCSTRMNTDKHTQTDTIVTAVTPVRAQPLWQELTREQFKDADTLRNHFKNYRLFALDSLTMQTILAKSPKENQRNVDSLKLIIELPRPDGGFMKFSIYRTTVMDPALEANYPLLRTYGGQGVDDRTANVRLDFNPNGFHAYVVSQAGEWFIQPPAHGITHQYLLCFFKRDVLIKDRKPFELPDSQVK